MRCRECNIDVADNISCCPLCGAEVFEDAPALPQLGDIPYPSSYQPYPKEKRTFTSFSAAKYSARAAAAVGSVLNIAGRAAHKEPLITAASAMSALSGAVSLFSCLTEKGELMKGSMPLFISTAAAVSCALPHGKKHTVNRAAAVSVGALAVMNAVAFLSDSDSMREQYKAAFRIWGEQK